MDSLLLAIERIASDGERRWHHVWLDHDGLARLQEVCEGASGLSAYPVGVVYTTVTSADPGDTFGGTWQRMPGSGGTASVANPHSWRRTA